MFGYVKPDVGELLVKEHEFYKATYCGICRAMKKHTGFLSNVTLSYDSVIMALVRMNSLPDSDIGAKMRRCGAHPLKKRCMLNENDALRFTAKAFAILTYYKLKDDRSDREKFLKRMLASLASPIMNHARKKSKEPSVEELIAQKLGEINRLEDEKCPSIDEPARAFGELLGGLLAWGFEGNTKTVNYEFGLSLGKFIYAADAAEDYDKDRESGSYNPYVLAYGGVPLTYENRQSIKLGLVLECRHMEGAVNLMEFGNRATIEGIVKNIVFLGLLKRIDFLDKNENTITEDKGDCKK